MWDSSESDPDYYSTKINSIFYFRFFLKQNDADQLISNPVRQRFRRPFVIYIARVCKNAFAA